MALKLVNAAAEVWADAVKVQRRDMANLYSNALLKDANVGEGVPVRAEPRVVESFGVELPKAGSAAIANLAARPPHGGTNLA